jgi:hypothetical protein
MHSPVQCLHPKWTAWPDWDADRDLAAEEQQLLANEAGRLFTSVAAIYPAAWEDAYVGVVKPAVKAKHNINVNFASLYAVDQIAKLASVTNVSVHPVTMTVDGQPPILFSGDHLFAGSIGRTDLPGGSMEQLMGSMATKILPLADDTQVLPGHGQTTTIGHERRTNPFLLELTQRGGHW